MYGKILCENFKSKYSVVLPEKLTMQGFKPVQKIGSVQVQVQRLEKSGSGIRVHIQRFFNKNLDHQKICVCSSLLQKAAINFVFDVRLYGLIK